MKKHLCRTCGETTPKKFYGTSKCLCMVCTNKRNRARYSNHVYENAMSDEQIKQWNIDNPVTISSATLRGYYNEG